MPFITIKLWVRTPLMARCTRYNIMWSSLSMICDRSVGFSGDSGLLYQQNLPLRYNWNIVESGAKHHSPNPNPVHVSRGMIMLSWSLVFDIENNILRYKRTILPMVSIVAMKFWKNTVIKMAAKYSLKNVSVLLQPPFSKYFQCMVILYIIHLMLKQKIFKYTNVSTKTRNNVFYAVYIRVDDPDNIPPISWINLNTRLSKYTIKR